jgi:hypothetical protein
LREAGKARSFVSVLRLLLQIAALGIVVAALLGFMNLARGILTPTVQTLFDLGLGLFVVNVIMDVVPTLLGREVDPMQEDTSLLPIAVTAVVGLAFLPVLALN